MTIKGRRGSRTCTAAEKSDTIPVANSANQRRRGRRAMRSKITAKSRRRKRRRKKRTKPQPLPGGKVLQRLFDYLGARDPTLNDHVIATTAVPEAVRQRFGLTKRALRARPVEKPLAIEMGKAAVALTARRLNRGRRAAREPTWEFIGPSLIPNGQTIKPTHRVHVVGRVSSIAIDPENPTHLLVGAAAGGIWESANTGTSWQPRSDHLPSLAIGAIAFDPNNPKRVYAGSGEGNYFFNLGAGVYASGNRGRTWKVLAAVPFRGIGFYDLVLDPKNPSVLYAATTEGFYKSTNGGKSWSHKRKQKCWDISVHSNGGSVELLAAFSDGLFVSNNAGNTFAPAALPAPPKGPWLRLAVDHVRTSSDIAYAFGAIGTDPHLWRRARGSWTKITTLPPMDSARVWTRQAHYNWYVAATPDNEFQVYLGALRTYRGDLAGNRWTWTDVTAAGDNAIHKDQHCLTFSPENSNIIYAGNDGGIYRSTNSGATWTPLNKGLGITEIEYLANDPDTSKWLMAGTQDNGTIRYAGSTVWDLIADEDGGDCDVDHRSPNVIYHSAAEVTLERSNDKGKTWTDLVPPSLESLFYPPVEVCGSTVAIGAVSLIVTHKGGPPWTTVPLGLVDKEFPSAMRFIDANTILIGTTHGRMLRVSWTGAAWETVQLTSPTPRYISCIAVDPSNPQRFWVTIQQVGDGRVYRSDNSGADWVDCSRGLRPIPMNAVAVDPANHKRVWVAADVGVYQTFDLGKTWKSFSDGLPNAIAADLIFHKQDRMLICGTRSRGVWVIPVPLSA